MSKAETPLDLAIIGAGAAGLMTAICAGRTAQERAATPRIALLDGARSLGAKILVAGGGRCNVTHDVVTEDAYNGASRKAIRKVLKRFDVPETIAFFAELGVELKREDTGKLFPTTDRARTVLNALLHAARDAGVDIEFPWRVESITRDGGAFTLTADDGQTLRARHLVLATGGRSLPKTGSDGHGYTLVRALGHTITKRVFPALVPLTLDQTCFLRALSGVATEATLEVRRASGKRLERTTGSLLCTHFGLSGPCALDISRHWIDARADGDAVLAVNWLPDETPESLDSALLNVGKTSAGRWLSARLPERLAKALCEHAGVDPATACEALTRDQRKALARTICDLELPVTGDKGFAKAEVTAGGVPLTEVRLESMQSRICDNLSLVGEILDVDGRIGGYNFQWAWASGYVAGTALGTALAETNAPVA